MRYKSTRGQVSDLSFTEAVLMGLASDGGLLLPESVPDVGSALLCGLGLYWFIARSYMA